METKKNLLVILRCSKAKKTTSFQIPRSRFWKQLKFHLNLLLTRTPKQKREELKSLSKSKEIRLNKLYSRGRAAYGSIRNLSRASG